MDEYPRPPAPRMLGRALRRRCPLCGGAGLFTDWIEPKDACPSCQLKLDRGEGDFCPMDFPEPGLDHDRPRVS